MTRKLILSICFGGFVYIMPLWYWHQSDADMQDYLFYLVFTIAFVQAVYLGYKIEVLKGQLNENSQKEQEKE